MDGKLLLLVGVLATWRLARDWVYEEGPLGWYGQTRRYLRGWAEAQIEQSDLNDPKDHPWYWLYDGVECIVCASFWAALVVAVLVTFSQRWGLANGLVTWFGLAGGALITERLYMQGVAKHGPF